MSSAKVTAKEIVLPASIVNGDTDTDGAEGSIEFLEEHDPEHLNALNSKQHIGEEEIEMLTEEEGEYYEYEERVEDEEEEEPIAPEDNTPVTRKPTQVPKKRKNPIIDADEITNNDIKISKKSQQIKKEDQATSSAKDISNKENEVDEEQCRVCTSKEDLVSLFKKIDKYTIADMLMTICPTVSIARKDFMPQYVCNVCVDNITIAMKLKTLCETTERDLRKKLSRSKNKVRRPTGYVVIDAPAESDPASEEELNDDVEFKVSEEGSISAGDDSDDSDFSTKKKRPVRSTAGRRGRRKSNLTPASQQKEKKRMGRPPMKRNIQAVDSSGEEKDTSLQKKKRMSGGDTETSPNIQEYACDQCDHVYTRKLSLVLHKKSHDGARQPISCEICGKKFKIQGAYRTHLEKHKDDSVGFNCEKCEKILGSKSDLRRHLAEAHNEPGLIYQCEKCKKVFVSETRLDRHQEGRCPGVEHKPTKRHDHDAFSVVSNKPMSNQENSFSSRTKFKIFN
ncbi:zinc finger and BTB domain-containing protein 11-like [Teleopsis dalmanni]|uniref:zinc finger and BTB domain-containing protein 11-like n=1 Tax=Teleopsis dalmanni TaxID=139649 RepID=UPI0018CEE774|nr:zinc finger and BTB domain-containing protein 11-like [Teleopsis dalmanni]